MFSASKGIREGAPLLFPYETPSPKAQEKSRSDAGSLDIANHFPDDYAEGGASA